MSTMSAIMFAILKEKDKKVGMDEESEKEGRKKV